MFMRLNDQDGHLVLINFSFVKRATVHPREGTALTLSQDGTDTIVVVRESFEQIAQRLGLDAPGELRQLRAV